MRDACLHGVQRGIARTGVAEHEFLRKAGRKPTVGGGVRLGDALRRREATLPARPPEAPRLPQDLAGVNTDVHVGSRHAADDRPSAARNGSSLSVASCS